MSPSASVKVESTHILRTGNGGQELGRTRIITGSRNRRPGASEQARGSRAGDTVEHLIPGQSGEGRRRRSFSAEGTGKSRQNRQCLLIVGFPIAGIRFPNAEVKCKT